MNKSEVVTTLSTTTGVDKTNVQHVLDSLAGLVKREMAAGNELVIPGLGKFEVRHKRARTMNSPHGGKMDVAARNVVAFKPAKEIRESAPVVS